MIILKKKLIYNKIKNFKNFEEIFYPQIIKKHKCVFKRLSGFWHSIDNVKDINILKNDRDKRKKIIRSVRKLNK